MLMDGPEASPLSGRRGGARRTPEGGSSGIPGQPHPGADTWTRRCGPGPWSAQRTTSPSAEHGSMPRSGTARAPGESARRSSLQWRRRRLVCGGPFPSGPGTGCPAGLRLLAARLVSSGRWHGNDLAGSRAAREGAGRRSGLRLHRRYWGCRTPCLRVQTCVAGTVPRASMSLSPLGSFAGRRAHPRWGRHVMASLSTPRDKDQRSPFQGVRMPRNAEALLMIVQAQAACQAQRKASRLSPLASLTSLASFRARSTAKPCGVDWHNRATIRSRAAWRSGVPPAGASDL